MYTLDQIAEITNIKLVGKNNYSIHHFLNDSRSVLYSNETLFIALRTERNNGHNYIPELIEKGVTSFLISENDFNTSPYSDSNISFLVSIDPLKTIQQLAAYHRQQFSIPVIGITGSNGKTVVKEWLYQLLKTNYSICRSPKSYNSQIGVPLSVLNLNASHTLAIFEAGISQPGEMETLASIIRPTIGVLTSIGSAHDEGFKNREEKIQEKIKLLLGSDALIISGLEKNKISESLQKKSVFVSEYNDADLKVKFENNTLHLKSKNVDHTFKIPFSDLASLSNTAACVGVMLHLGFKEKEIAEKIKLLQPVALRLEIKKGIHNSLIINDYYNSDLDSLKIALTHLQQQNNRLKKMVIVSDIEQSGISPSDLYHNLADLFSQYEIDLVVGIGKEIIQHKPLFKSNSLFFESTQNFIEQFRFINYQFSDAGILLKGGRSFGFENISRLLQLKSHDTVFEIDLNKLTENVNYYRSLISKEVKIMGMVKAMGYGSGSTEIARTLQHMGVDYLAVAYADEGVELRASHISLPIMVMSPEEDAFEDIINYQLEPEIYHFKVLRSFVAKLDSMGITEPYPVHLKIDTGMHRLGFEEQDFNELLKELQRTPQLKVQSVFSHLSGSDNPDLDAFTKEQIRIFESAYNLLEKGLGYTVIKHICNSGAITRFKEAHYNMVRLGIGMYGVGVNEKEQNKLKNVGTLKTRISQIKNVVKGQTVSYNRSGKINSDTKIATIPIGYADGFSRALGNGKHGVYIQNTFCKTVGNICMDMCMVDVTAIRCNEGEEVIIFENAEQINVMAQAINSISYEVLTSVSARVKRVYVQE
ncbi:bifunctional UDP-N-acetylmuramoyl-tripeptide:D-alanyl-D-alanine ligase/alanine racemase [Aurantibacillus circumpalustris]|uniref:bifunctional UDP-N-acetylmuramoyl-tripeptide:D-alanyl-D-alanine ligase/alanine racemase n=1 Tax=Aurantibacillus circumpalustris TaxID=3036359 RepID=UPI00295ABFA9|nr:bifunctional UDP-N-acetylmuramoyl-tripeptide:D-alanyl-D-alanine ligase/alanine racemase [Aurantibacillus circumpalustris]